MIQPHDFNTFAGRILNSDFIVNGHTLNITEIEFYYYNENHPDPYTHKNDDQKDFGLVYFHKHKNGRFKGGTFKGMDLVFGDENTYFGVLIRGLRYKDTVIYGPSCCVDYILKLYSLNAVLDGVRYNTNNGPISLILNDKVLSEFWTGRRIGLSGKYPEFRDLKYRYVSDKKYTRKEKNSLSIINHIRVY